ncbi:MAG TPA: hypothetical protein PKC19_04140, partial [Roseiflexaceae bacterium]|nr:hypothetical protein [Roseiflexaceae bacterium]
MPSGVNAARIPAQRQPKAKRTGDLPAIAAPDAERSTITHGQQALAVGAEADIGDIAIEAIEADDRPAVQVTQAHITPRCNGEQLDSIGGKACSAGERDDQCALSTPQARHPLGRGCDQMRTIRAQLCIDQLFVFGIKG